MNGEWLNQWVNEWKVNFAQHAHTQNPHSRNVLMLPGRRQKTKQTKKLTKTSHKVFFFCFLFFYSSSFCLNLMCLQLLSGNANTNENLRISSVTENWNKLIRRTTRLPIKFKLTSLCHKLAITKLFNPSWPMKNANQFSNSWV